jgi:HD superfamily phosphodiesterase
MTANLNLPSQAECLELFKQYHTPANIIRHSLAVNKVANYLASSFKKAGVEINGTLVDRASLLHDLLRVCDIKNNLYTFNDPQELTNANKKIWQEQREKYKNQHHAEITADLFKQQYPEMAEVIRKHRLSAVIKNQLVTWEEKIVYYADKRVNHDKFVSLEERMSEGKKRWQIQKSQDYSKQIINAMERLEKEIFQLINKQPDEINKL